MMKNILLFVLSLVSLVCFAQSNAKHVILITIDGMRGDMITDATSPTENLKELKRGGLWVNWIKGVAPAETYPSHTTIITGLRPCDHHIYYNAPFMGNEPRTISNWYADSIHGETLWQAVSATGGKVASLFWPVSTGAKGVDYNVPEFWSLDMKVNQMEYLKDYCKPVGLLDTLEKYATGVLRDENFTAGSVNRDAYEAYMTNFILNHYKPTLLTLHLITTDYAQHQTGLSTDRTRRTYESVDNAVGLIIDNLRATKMIDSTVVIVTGDHGFVDVDRVLAPNIWLVKNGLLGQEYGTPWKACFHGAGAMSFLYLKDKNDTKTLAKVRKIIDELPDSTRSLFRVLDKAELKRLGCDPQAAMAVEPLPGIAVSNAHKGNDLVHRIGGTHGYSTGVDHTALIAYGAGIKPEQKQYMEQTSIKSFVLGLLGSYRL